MAATAASLLVAAASSCCCCSGEWFPEYAQPSDRPEIEDEARAYVQQNAQALFPPPDAGPAGSECFDGTGLVLDLATAVFSRGHAGPSAAGTVRFDLRQCVRAVVVYVVKRAGAWVAVGAVVLDAVTGMELLRLGDPPPTSSRSRAAITTTITTSTSSSERAHRSRSPGARKRHTGRPGRPSKRTPAGGPR